MADEAGPGGARASSDERRRAAAALERLRAKLAEKEEWRRHVGAVAALKETLDSPLFAHVLALQRAVAHLKGQLLTPLEEPDPSPPRSVPTDFSATPALQAPPSPERLQRWIATAAAGRPTERVRLARPPSGGLGFSVAGLQPGSGAHRVLVKHIQPGGVAARDGRLRVRDEILVINGRPLEAGMSQSQALTLLQLPGGTLDMTVARDHPPGDLPQTAAADVEAAEGPQVEAIQLLNDGSGLGFGIVGGKTAGVVVRTLVEGGAAHRDGRLRTGDRILRIGTTPTDGLSSDEVVRVLQGCGSHVTMLVARDGCGQRAKAPPPPPPDSAPVSLIPPRQAAPSKMPNLDGYEIHEVPLTKKDGQSLGISIIGHNPLTSQDAVGVFIKHVLPGSAAHHSGNIRVQDRLIALDGVSLHGLTNQEVVEVMKRTGRTVILTLVRKNNAAGAGVETSRGSLRRSLELKTHSTYEDTSSAPDAAAKAKWQQALGPNYEVLVIKLDPAIEDDARPQRSSKILPVHTLRLGVELDSFEGHHYVSCVLPGGPADKDGVLRPEDELLEVNGVRLYGKSRREVVSFLKDAPPPFTLLCCRQPASDSEAERESEPGGRRVDQLEMQLAPCGGAGDAPREAEQVAAMSLELRDEEEPGGDGQEDEEQDDDEEAEGGELAVWSAEVDVLELHKEAGRGLGFSILDYQDPMDARGCVTVIRSLVAGGAAERAGAPLPGDRLVSVNGIRLEGLSLERAVRVLKEAAPGAVRLAVRRPLPGRGQAEEETERGGTAAAWPTPVREGREMAVDDEDADEAESVQSASPSPERRRRPSTPNSWQAGTEDAQVAGEPLQPLTLHAVKRRRGGADAERDAESDGADDTETQGRRNQRGSHAAGRGRRELPRREDGEGEETPRFSHWGPPRRVEVWPEEGRSLGLSIVGGHHVIKRLRNGEDLKGIFIKQVLPGSPAHATRALKTGDKILQVARFFPVPPSPFGRLFPLPLCRRLLPERPARFGRARLDLSGAGDALLRGPVFAISPRAALLLQRVTPFLALGPASAVRAAFQIAMFMQSAQVSGVDLRGAGHQEAVDAIKSAGSPVVFLVQSLSANPPALRGAPPPYRPPGQSEQKLTLPEACRERYGDLLGEPLSAEPTEEGGGPGLSPAGNPDLPALSVFGAGPRPGVENWLLQVSDQVVDGRSHQNTSAFIESSASKVQLAPLRSPDGARQTAVPPFPPPPEHVLPPPSEDSPDPAEWPRPPDGDVLRPPRAEDADEDGGEENGEDPGDTPEQWATGTSPCRVFTKAPRDALVVRGSTDHESCGDVGSPASRDPCTRPVLPGQETTLEICKGPSGLGLSVAGGADTQLQAVVIAEVYEEGAAARDGRLLPGDHILEVDGVDLRRASHREAIAALRRPCAKAVVKVLRDGARRELPRKAGRGPGFERSRPVATPPVHDVTSGPTRDPSGRLRTVHISKGAGDSLGLSIAGGMASPLGDVPVFIAMIQHHGAAAKTRRLKVGDRIASINGRPLDAVSHEQAVAMLKEAGGNVRLQVVSDTDVAAIVRRLEKSPASARTRAGGRRTVVVEKTSQDLGFSIVGGVGSAHGDLPIYIKSVFNKDPAVAHGQPKRGDQVLSVNGESLDGATRDQAVAILKKHAGPVTLELLS